MKKRGIFNVNEERLKEFMANGTDAEGTPRLLLRKKRPLGKPIFSRPYGKMRTNRFLFPVNRPEAEPHFRRRYKSTEKIFSTVRLLSIESRLISVMTPTVGLHGFCRCSVTA